MCNFLRAAARYFIFAIGLMSLLEYQADAAFELKSIVYSLGQSRAEFEMSSSGDDTMTIQLPNNEVPVFLNSLKSTGTVTFKVSEVEGDQTRSEIKVIATAAVRIRYERAIIATDFAVKYNLDEGSQRLQAMAVATDKSGADATTDSLTVTYADSNGKITYRGVTLGANEFVFLNDAEEVRDVRIRFDRQAYLRPGTSASGTNKDKGYSVATLTQLEGKPLAIPAGPMAVLRSAKPTSFIFGGVLVVAKPMDIFLEEDSRLSAATMPAAEVQQIPYLIEATDIKGGVLIGPVWQFGENCTFTNNTDVPLKVRIGQKFVDELEVPPHTVVAGVHVRDSVISNQLASLDLLSIDDDAKLATAIAALNKVRILHPNVASVVQQVRRCYEELRVARAEFAARTKRRDSLAVSLEELRRAGADAGQLDHVRSLVHQADDDIALARSTEPEIKSKLVHAIFLASAENSNPTVRRAVIKHSEDFSASIAGR